MKKETRDKLNLLYMLVWGVVIGAVLMMMIFDPMKDSLEARIIYFGLIVLQWVIIIIGRDPFNSKEDKKAQRDKDEKQMYERSITKLQKKIDKLNAKLEAEKGWLKFLLNMEGK
jgi:hypothetical protein